MDEFKTGKYSTILGKPYLVYDIETTVVDDLKSAKYLLGYAMHPKGDRMEYECVMQEDLKDFVDRMLAFDGNNIKNPEMSHYSISSKNIVKTM